MNVLVPSIPGRLRVTQTMVEDFLCDPVLACKVILGFDLDVFQRVRLRLFWWVPNVIDSSGYSSGKTITDWAYVQLRCILLPEHEAGVYYPVFETGKNTFWPYYDRCRAPIFQAHLGREEMEDKGGIQGAACFKRFYRNGSKMLMPAPSFMKQAATQASMRFNTLLVEEWTHVDAASTGIDDQLVGRVTRPGYNQHHPLWANHIHFTAPAKTMMHPGYPRFRVHEREHERGNPDYSVFSFCYKDYSDLPCHTGKSYREEYRIEKNVQAMKKKMDRAEFLGEGLGVWSKHGRGWYTEEALLRCVAVGRERGLEPEVKA